MNATWSRTHTWGFLVAIVGIGFSGLVVSRTNQLVGWLLTLLLLAVFLAITSHGVTGLWHGWLIDSRNRMSLSRLQMTLWTVILVSAFFSAVLVNVNIMDGKGDALAVAIPNELWLVMGIATTSLVGSPLILSNKKSRQPQEAEWTRTRDAMISRGFASNSAPDPSRGLVTNPDTDAPPSVVLENKSAADARLSNMFSGDETGNGAVLDLGKIQMFLFTIILVLVYGIAIGSMLRGNTGAITALPPLREGAVALLAISHSGYLADKIVPHSQTQ